MASDKREPGERPGTMAGLRTVVQRTTPPVSMDDFDRKLLHRLAVDPRISQRQLAREIGMSAPAVAERLNRLERAGVITGYTVEVDWGALGYPMLVYIPMVITPGTDLAALMAVLSALPEVDELVTVTGNYDLIARLRLRDHQHLQDVLLDQLWPLDGLQRIETFLSLGTVAQAGSVLSRLTGPGAPLGAATT